MAWRFYHPYRWRILVAILYMVVLYFLGVQYIQEDTDFVTKILAFTFFLTPVSVILVFPFALFSDAYGTDILVEETTLKKCILNLPVSTKEIVFWHMLLGIAGVEFCWLIASQCIELLWFSKIELSYVWPYAFVAALMAWTQVFAWRPFGSAIARTVFAAVILFMLFVSIPILTSREIMRVVGLEPFSEVYLFCFYAGLVGVAYFVAIDSVNKARCGDVPEWNGIKSFFRKMEFLIKTASPEKFQSSKQAFNWYEWHSSGNKLPVCMYVITPVILTFILINYALRGFMDIGWLIALLEIPVILCCALGFDMGGFGNSRGEKKVRSFILAKPVACREIIRTKFWNSLKSIIKSFQFVYFIVLIGLIFSDKAILKEFADRINEIYSPLEIIVLFLIALSAPILLSWMVVTCCTPIGMTGRPWVIVTFVFLVISFLIGMSSLEYWASRSPMLEEILQNSEYLVGSFIIFELILFSWLVFLVRKEELYLRSDVLKIILAGTVSFCVIWGLSYWLIEVKRSIYVDPAIILMLLLIPMISIMAAPLALNWNRHR